MKGILLFVFALLVWGAVASPTSPKVRLLVTGFGSFLNYTNNPSGAVAKALNGQIDHVSPSPFRPLSFELIWEGVEVPVDHVGAKTATQLLKTKPCFYDGVIHLGLEDSAKGLRLEVAAVNVLANATQDGTPIVAGGPELLPTTTQLGDMSLVEMQEWLRKETSVSEVWSRDAGTYFCNETLYRTLYYVRESRVCVCGRRETASCDIPHSQLLPVIFVHLPDPATVDVATDITLVQHIGWALGSMAVGIDK